MCTKFCTLPNGWIEKTLNTASIKDLINFDAKLRYYEQCISKMRAIGNRHYEFKALDLLSNVYFNVGEINRAIECLEKALAIAQDLNDKKNEIDILIKLGCAFASLRRVSDTLKALTYFEKALDIATQTDASKEEINSYISKARLQLAF